MERENFKRIGISEKGSSEHSGPGGALSEIKNSLDISVVQIERETGSLDGDRAVGTIHAEARRERAWQRKLSAAWDAQNTLTVRPESQGERRENGAEAEREENLPEPGRGTARGFQKLHS